jgi:D-xylose transport system substrate-binding protein
VIAQDSSTAGAIVESAHEAGIPVVAHDRLIADCDLDYYASFDCYVVGQILEVSLRWTCADRQLFLIPVPTDNNAHLMREGQMTFLQLRSTSDIKLLSSVV